MLTFIAKNKLGFMRKSLFYKRTLHTKDGVIPQYCNKEGSYLKEYTTQWNFGFRVAFPQFLPNFMDKKRTGDSFDKFSRFSNK